MEGCKALLIVLLFLAFFDTWKCQSSGVNECSSFEDIPCDNSHCISRSDWCDGVEDCRDGSDEKYCKFHGWYTRVDNKCTEKHFVCKSGKCVPVAARCDGFDDCGDSSDENECHESTIRSPVYSTTSDKNSPEPNFPVINNQNSFDNPDRDISRTTYTTAASSAIISSMTIDYYEKHRQASAYPNQQNIYNDYRNGILRANNNQPNGNNQNNYPDQRYPQRHYGLSSQRPEEFRPPFNEPTPCNCNQKSRSSPSRNTEVVTEATTVSYRWLTPRTTTEHPRYGNRYDSTTVPQSYIVQRRLPSIIQPRTLLNPPNPREPYPYYAGHKSEHRSLQPFFFLKNFTREYGHKYQREVDRAKQWLLSQRDTSAGWGRDTPRALVALSLITNSFTSDISDNDLMMKGFQTHLGMTILRNKTEKMTPVRLASYINALLATCQNPRNFLELDLANILYQQRRIRPLKPFVYLTLCLSDVAVDEKEIHELAQLLFTTQVNIDEVIKDNHILATSALACFLQKTPYNFALKEKVRAAAESLIKAQSHDGSFGNIYGTALAAQALMSVNISENWNSERMLDYIAGYQSADGSFGDMMATYYSVPALSGRSLLHLRNTQCKKAEKIQDDSWIYDIIYPPGITERKDILYTVAIGYPERSSVSLPLNVPVGATLLNVMRVAAYLNPRLKFEYKTSYDNTDVHTISNIPNDPELRLHWNMYELKKSDETVDLMQRSTKDIKNLAITKDSEEFLFWYLPPM